MKVHKEGTGLLLTLFTIFFVVDVALYHTVVGRGWVFYTTTFVTTVLFLLVLTFSVARSVVFRSIRKDW